MEHQQQPYGYPASSSSRQPGFDGPGARPILGGQGPSSHQHQHDRDKMGGAKSPTPVSEPRGVSSPGQEGAAVKRVGGKANVSSACGPCKRAHLACDVARPCKRCINMGKEDQCEDVPHKKRGRPKVPKPALGEPYHRARPPSTAESSTGVGKWKGGSYDAPYMSNIETPLPPLLGRTSPRIGGIPAEADPSYTGAPPTNQPFTLFTTTELKVLRASPSCYSLIGYHPNEFVNLNMLDWIHPQDRHLIDIERNRLLTVPYVDALLRSSDVSQAAITQRTEMELLSPAEGMREPYPNKNVRVLHSDSRFSPFNVRLHLGGGLGASLWQPGSLGRVYLVVSFLAIPARPTNFPPEMPMGPPRRSSQVAPPTPITPLSVPPSNSQGLPGFSSIAAAADAPQTRYDQPPQSYFPPPTSSRPLSSQSAYPFPPRSAGGMPPLSGPGPSSGSLSNAPPPPVYTRRSPSPTPSYRTPQTSSYPVQPADYPHPPPQSYYPDPSYPHRRPSEDDRWNGNGSGGMSGRTTLPPPPAQGGYPPGGDGSRRAWEL